MKLNEILDTWRTLHKENALIVQNYKPGVDLKVSNVDFKKRAKEMELAKVLCEHIEEMDIGASEKYEIRQSAKQGQGSPS